MKNVIGFFLTFTLVFILTGCATTGYGENDYVYRRVPDYQPDIYYYQATPPPVVHHYPRSPVYLNPPPPRYVAPQVRPPIHHQPQTRYRPPTTNRSPIRSVPRAPTSRSSSSRYKR